MKTSVSLTDNSRQIGDALKQRLGLDSLSATIEFALRYLGGVYGIINPQAGGSNGGDSVPAALAKEPWGYTTTGVISDPFKIAAKNMGKPVAWVSFKKDILGAYKLVDDPTERVYIQYAADLSKKMRIPVPPGVVSWHLSGHKRWRKLVALAKQAIENHGEEAFQAAAEAMYSGDPQPMLQLLYPKQ